MGLNPINIDLHLLEYQNQIVSRNVNDQPYLLDPIRKKWIFMTPEELVRQLTLLYLIDLASPSKRLISVEKAINVNGKTKRFDILLYDDQANPKLLVECKNPKVKISNETFIQIAQYNIALKVPRLLVTNGKDSFCCSINFETGKYAFLDEVNLF